MQADHGAGRPNHEQGAHAGTRRVLDRSFTVEGQDCSPRVPHRNHCDAQVSDGREVDAGHAGTLPIASTADVTSAAIDSTAPESQQPSDVPSDLLPKQRAWGFLAFVVCALTITSVAIQRQAGSLRLEVAPPSGAVPLSLADVQGSSPLEARPIDSVPSIVSRATAKPSTDDRSGAPAAMSKASISKANSTLGVVEFDPASIVTSERAVTAVFIVKRTDPVRGRASVQWAVHSGSADAAIDFSDAYGTVRFADGQRQLAIFVPLRNDHLKEEPETFKVCLRSPRQARIGSVSCAEATIRDDDVERP